MSKVLRFNKIPHPPKLFPLTRFDVETELQGVQLVCSTVENLTFRHVLLELLIDGETYPCGEIKLYHSGNVFNYEQVFWSAKDLGEEIAKRFNTYYQRSQLSFEL